MVIKQVPASVWKTMMSECKIQQSKRALAKGQLQL